MQGGKFGGLRKKRGVEGQSTMLPLPVSGLCSRSTNQWTAGILNLIWADNPCLTNNDINDYTGLTFQTRQLNRAVRFRGPINAHLFVSSAGGDGMLSVAVEDVAPDGTVTPDHRRLAGDLPAQADQGEVALPRRQADPAVAPVHQGGEEAS